MMIKWLKSLTLLSMSVCCSCVMLAQGTDSIKVAVGLFDLDHKIDTIYYQYKEKAREGPVYQCEMILSGTDKKRRTFSIGVTTTALIITDCGKGCISTYEWITGYQGQELEMNYKYNKKFDNWILKSKTVNNKKIKLSRNETLQSIDGRMYSEKCDR